MNVVVVDHLVLTVRDLDAIVASYRGVLGMLPVESGRWALGALFRRPHYHGSP